MAIVREKKKIRVQSLNGGEDSTSEASVIQPPFATLARGVTIDQLGKYPQRLGPSRTGDNPDDLVSDWRFNDSASTDFKGSNTGTDTSITYDTGRFGIGAHFNGTTSSIVVAADSTIDATSVDAPFCITAEIYALSDGENDIGRIVDKMGAATAGYRFWVHSQSGSTVKLSFEVDYSTTNALVVTSTTMSTEAWHTVEAHLNSDKSLDIYIDGSIASYSTDTTGVGTIGNDSANDLYIGNRAQGDAAFHGVLERVRFYNDTRSSTEYEKDKIYGLTRYKVGNTIDRLYRIRDTNLERLDDTQKAWTEIDTGFTADKTTNFVQGKDLLFILNGTENVHSMDSSETVTDEGQGNEAGLGSDTNPPRSTFGAWAQNNRLFLSGSLTESLRDYVWFSDSLDPQTFNTNATTGNFFRVKSGSGGKVTWLAPFKLNELIIYKEDSIHVLDMTGSTPLTDWTLQPINTTVGCRAGRTVQDTGNDQVFLDDQGFVRILSRTTFDKLKTSVVSGPVQAILDEINFDSIDKACSLFLDGKYYLSIPTGTNTENNVTLIWDTEAATLIGNMASGWTVIPTDIWYPSVWASYEFGDNTIRAVHADNRSISYVYKHDANTDDGAVIEAIIAGPAHDMGNRATTKIWGPLHAVWDAGENTTVEMFAEFDETGFQSLGTFSLAGNAPVLPIDLPFALAGSQKSTQLLEVRHLGSGKTCRIKASHRNYNQTATFVEYELYGEERIPRKQ